MKRSLILALLLAGCGKSAPPDETAPEAPTPVTVETALVGSGDVEDALTVDGSLVPPEGTTAKLAPSVAGRLAEVRVKEGDPVVAGALLARIDTRPLLAAKEGADAGAAAAEAAAEGSGLAYRAAQADGKAAVQAATSALAVARAEGRAGVQTAANDLQRLRAGARPQEIAQAQEALDAARIARDKARLDADRDVRLLKEGLVAGSQADASAAALRAAETGVRSAASALDLVRAGSRPEDIRGAGERLASARTLAAKREQAAQAALRQAQAGRLAVAAKGEDAAAARLSARQKAADARAAADAVRSGELRSPFSGYVVRRLLNPGDLADPTTPVLAVAARKPRTDFVGALSPAEAARVLPGMRIAVGGLEGRVAAVGGVDPNTGLVALRAHLDGSATAGGFATARVVLATLRGVATVPKGAILSRDGGDAVFVAKGGVAHLTKITLGPATGDLVAVLKGVSKGGTVVVLGGHELSDGATVQTAAKG